MKKWQCVMSLVLLSGCAALQPVRTAPVEQPRCMWNGVIPERACFYSIQDIAHLEHLADAPVNVSGGYLHRLGEVYLLSVDRAGEGPFVVMDDSPLPVDELPYGLLPLLGWRTVQLGYFTSADVQAPVVPGAAGTLRAHSMGFHGDPDTPEGPHRKIARRQHAARTSGDSEVILAVPAAATESCAAWQLDETEATLFFDLSDELDASAARGATRPCAVEGLIEADGKTWQFAINPGRTAIWHGDDQTRYWSCSSAECVALLPDPVFDTPTPP